MNQDLSRGRHLLGGHRGRRCRRGGQVLVFSSRDTPIRDPQGAVFTLSQYSPLPEY
jgi:hypothetical protein